MEKISIALCGPGDVGSKLLQRTIDIPRFGYVVIADSSGATAKYANGSYHFFDKTELQQIIGLKQRGYKLKDYKNDRTVFYNEVIDAIGEIPSIDVLVDTTDVQSYPILMVAADRGLHVVGSNKQPYADVTFSQYKELIAKVEEKGLILDDRTTVSANLGALPRVREFVDTGGISHIRGCLSGTMAYIPYRMNQGSKFSQGLSEARDRQYTERDERVDLIGKDFARKVVEIGRAVGVPLELISIKVEEYLPKELLDIPIEEFRKRVPELDDVMESRVKKAQQNGCVLRFIGELDFDRNVYEVGFRGLQMDDPQATTKGCWNKVTIYPRAWEGESMSVEGPGAGLPYTAQGLEAGLHDIRRLKERISSTNESRPLAK
ncbi:MAG: hypothetical protein V1900_01790 [Candidatus Aenigmatarchaeota archaeon]